MKAKPKGSKRRLVMWISLFLCLVCAGSSVCLLLELNKYKEGSKSYDGLEQYVTPVPMQSGGGEDDPVSPALPEVDFKALYDINPDIAGWLYSPGTPINYPVVQGQDNDRYLTHLFDGTANKAGCLFVDKDNTPNFLDNNTVVYGHNMLDQSMFSTLFEYKKPKYYKEHPVIYLLTPMRNYEIHIFSAYEAHVDDDSWVLRFSSDEEYCEWLKATSERSLIESGVILTPGSPTLTLSTCVNGMSQYRFVVAGKVVPLPKN